MVVEKGGHGQASEILYGGRESMGESGGYREGETVSVNRGFHRGKEINMGYCIYYREGEQCPSLKTFSRGRKSAGEGVVAIGKGDQCQSRETLLTERTSKVCVSQCA